MAHHFHAVVWIDHKQARVFHFSVDEAEKTVIRPGHSVTRHPSRREAHRTPDRRGPQIFEAVAQAIADAGAILIVGPSEEKHELRQIHRGEASGDQGAH